MSTIQVVTPENLGSGLPVREGQVTAVSVSRQVISSARSVFITTANEVVPVEDWQPYIFGYFTVGMAPLNAQALADALAITGGKVTMPAGMSLATLTGFTSFYYSGSPTYPSVFGLPTLSHTSSQLKYTWQASLSAYPYIKPFVSINGGFGRWKVGTVSDSNYDWGAGLLTVPGGSSQTNAKAAVAVTTTDSQATLDMAPVTALKLMNAIQISNEGYFVDESNPTPAEKLAFATNVLRPLIPTTFSNAFNVSFADIENVAYGENQDGTVTPPTP